MPTADEATIVRRPSLARCWTEDKWTPRSEVEDVRRRTDAPAPTIATGAVHAARIDIEYLRAIKAYVKVFKSPSTLVAVGSPDHSHFTIRGRAL